MLTVHFLIGGPSPVYIFNCSWVVSIPSGFAAPSRATGNGLPGKRPHGNRIRAWGLSASRSAPILHRISSLDGVQATGEYTSPHSELYIHPNKPGKLYSGSFIRGAPQKCGNKTSFALRFSVFFLLKLAQFAFLFFLNNKKTWEKRQQKHSCDGHNDCGAGCLCLWSVAYCDNSQPVLLSAVLLARWTNCGLFLGWKCGQQTRRHGTTEVKRDNTTSLSPFRVLRS